MPATSQEPPVYPPPHGGPGWKLWSTKEGVGETSGQPVGSYNGSLTRLANDPAEGWFGNETFFIWRGDRVSTVAGGTAAVDFDPDVFADALVFLPGACPTCRARRFPHRFSIIVIVGRHRCLMLGRSLRVTVAPCDDGYRFAKRQGKSAIQE